MGARLGQHFLTNPQIADQIVQAAGIAPGTQVVEIGPGRGILTRRLLDGGAQVTAVELDARLCETLKREFGGIPAELSRQSSSQQVTASTRRLQLLHADFLKLPLSELPSPCVFVSNLPYAVAAPILQRILSWDGWTCAILMFQKEVGKRILAGPGSRKYGVLSVSVALKAGAEFVCAVPKIFFTPRPQVDSAVLRLVPFKESKLPSELSEERVMQVARAAFQHRRKKAANSIALSLHLPQATVESALRRAGVSATARAEEMPLETYINVARHLP